MIELPVISTDAPSFRKNITDYDPLNISEALVAGVISSIDHHQPEGAKLVECSQLRKVIRWNAQTIAMPAHAGLMTMPSYRVYDENKLARKTRQRG